MSIYASLHHAQICIFSTQSQWLKVHHYMGRVFNILLLLLWKLDVSELKLIYNSQPSEVLHRLVLDHDSNSICYRLRVLALNISEQRVQEIRSFGLWRSSCTLLHAVRWSLAAFRFHPDWLGHRSSGLLEALMDHIISIRRFLLAL